MTFKKYLEEQIILNESLLEIPEKILKPIMDFYVESYKKYKSMDMKRVDSRSFPPKVFPLDFSGTRFEFLNKLNPKPSVKVYFKSGLSYYSDIDRESLEHTTFKKNMPMISLDFNNFRQSMYHIVEHEIIHVVQNLIRKYKFEYKNIRGDDYFRIKIGGLPSKHLIRGDVDMHGFRNNRRVEHSQRPIEAYTDALSLVRQMQAAYQHESKENPKIDKKEFFKKMLSEKGEFHMTNIKGDDLNNREYHVVTVNTDILKSFRKVGGGFYRKMLTIIYNAFVNGNDKFSVDYIEDRKKEIDKLQDIAIEKKKSEGTYKEKKILPEFYFNSDDLRMGILDFCDEFLNDRFVAKYFNGFITLGEYLGKSLGILKSGSEIVKFPAKTENIIRLFKRIRRKKKEKDIASSRSKIEDSEIEQFYDSLFMKMKQYYMRKSSWMPEKSQKLLESIINKI